MNDILNPQSGINPASVADTMVVTSIFKSSSPLLKVCSFQRFIVFPSPKIPELIISISVEPSKP